MAQSPAFGLVDVYAATIPTLAFTPGHVNYAETVLPMRDGLPKLKDFPKELGGSGETSRNSALARSGTRHMTIAGDEGAKNKNLRAARGTLRFPTVPARRTLSRLREPANRFSDHRGWGVRRSQKIKISHAARGTLRFPRFPQAQAKSISGLRERGATCLPPI